ncbi:hypothetical protein HW555_003659, partial [Spodoptera exigua]
AQTTVKATVKTTIDMKEELRKERYRFKYNPHKGYEPYWVGGDYVLTTTTPKPGTTVTEAPRVCLYDCNFVYQKIKAVCAIWVHELPDKRGYPGSGNPAYSITKAYKTYTYCGFLAEQCKQKPFDSERIMFVHLGKCITEEKLAKPLWESKNAVSRMQWYLTSFDLQEDPFKTTPTSTMATTKVIQ